MNIERVDHDRWREAQQWERAHWESTQKQRSRFGKNYVWRILSALGRVPKFRGDDWNEWWKKEFDDYAFLPKRIENAIEVGCGPYSNVRLMLDRTEVEHLVLSDPLIRTYAKFKLTFVSEMYRRVGCILDDHPLEELPFASNYFDLSIMINVLDHVRDAARCMDVLVEITKPGGILILGQDLSDKSDIERAKGTSGEIGHPIKLEHSWFDRWLNADRFTPLISKVLPRERGRGAEHHYGTLIFAGRKRA